MPQSRRQRFAARMLTMLAGVASIRQDVEPEPPAEVREDSVATTSINSAITRRVGGWASQFSALGFGTHDQKTTTEFITPGRIDDAELQALYAFSGIGRRIIDLAVNDATRKGYSLNTEVDDTLGFQVKSALDKVPVTTNRLTVKRGVLHAFNRAEKWARVYGGSVVVMGLEDGRVATEPLSLPTLTSLDFMRVLPRTVVMPDDYYRPGDPELIDKPELLGTVKMWTLHSTTITGDTEQMPRVHASRVLVFPGCELPPDAVDLGGVTGWPTVSFFDVIYNELRGMGITDGTADGLVQKSVLGIITFKNMQAALIGGGQSKLMERYRIMNLLQSSLRMMVLDGRAEEFNTVNFDFSGLATMLDRNPRRVSAVSGYPISLLFGTEQGGLNTGAHSGDRDNYHEGTVRGGIQEDKWRANMEHVIDLEMQAQTNRGEAQIVPFEMLWNPLVGLSEIDVVEARNKQAQTDLIYMDTGVLRPLEVRESRFAAPGVNLNTTLSATPDDVPDAGDRGLVALVDGTGAGMGAAAQDTALNGAQVNAALAIIQNVIQGTLSITMGESMLEEFFNLEPAAAKAILADAPSLIARIKKEGLTLPSAELPTT